MHAGTSASLPHPLLSPVAVAAEQSTISPTFRSMRIATRVLALASALAAVARAQYAYETVWTSQVLDHFNWNNNGSFQQRYLINDTWWRQPAPGVAPGPIFFYTGNEGAPCDAAIAQATSRSLPRTPASCGTSRPSLTRCWSSPSTGACAARPRATLQDPTARPCPSATPRTRRRPTFSGSRRSRRSPTTPCY
jgi:hypothetical protein